MSNQLQVSGAAKIRDIQGPVVANDGIITALDGLASQYVRGDGALADFPTTTGGGSSVSYYLNGSISQGTIGGVAYKQLSKTPIVGGGTDFTISSPGYVASFITDIGDPAADAIPGGNWNLEFYFNSSSVGGTPYFYVDVYKYDGTTFTLIGSNATAPEYINSGTTLDAYYTAVPIPQTVLATTDRIAIRVYVETSAKTITLHTENTTLCQVVTTFSRGMTTLNNLTKQVQYLAVGTAGTDFNISSSVDIHTFNIPNAGVANRGLITNLTQTIGGAKTFSSVLKTDGGFLLKDSTLGTIDGYTSIGGDLGSINIGYAISSIPYINNLGFTPATSNTYTFPNLTGTLALLEGTQTFTGSKTFNAAVTFNTGGVFNNWGISLYDGAGSTALVGPTLTGIFASKNASLTDIVISHYAPYDSKLRFSNDVADFTYTFPDITGTIALLEGTQTFSGGKTFDAAYFNGAEFINTAYFNKGFWLVKNGTPNVFTPLQTTIYSEATANNVVFRDNVSKAKLIFDNSTQTYTFPASSGTIALTSNLSSYVPYTGATANVDLGLFGLTSNAVKAIGDNSTYGGVISIKQNNVIGGLIGTGYTELFGKTNRLGISFGAGSIAYLSNSVLTAERTYTLPNASGTLALTSDLGSYVTLGTTQTITGAKTFSNGVTISNFSTFSLGSVTSFYGQLTLSYGISFSDTGSPAIFGNAQAFYVNRSGTTSSINIRRDNVGVGQDNFYQQLAFFNEANHVYTFPNASGTVALTSDIPSLTGYVTGSGTSGRVALFSSTSAIGNSQIYDNGTTVGIGIPVTSQNKLVSVSSTDLNTVYAIMAWGTGINTGGFYSVVKSGNIFMGQGEIAGVSATRITIANTGAVVTESTVQASAYRLTGMTAGSGALYWTSDRVTLANYNPTGVVHIEANGGIGVATFGGATYNNDFVGTGRFTGALNGTSATFNGAINARAGGYLALYDISTNTNRWDIYTNSDNSFRMNYNGAGNDELIISSTGAATFSSSVTATSSSFPIDIYGTTNNYGLRINNVQAATLFLYSSNANTANRNWGLFTNSNVFGDFDIRQSNAINGDLTNGANSTSRLYIKNDGNVGIGTPSPFSRLHVQNSDVNTGTIALGSNLYPSLIFSSASSGEFRLDNRTSFGGFITFYPNGQGTTLGSEAMRITSGGQTQVKGGTASFTSSLAVTNSTSQPSGVDIGFTAVAPNNTTNAFLYCYDSSVACFTIWSNGTTSGRSDARFKKNIFNATPKLDKLMQLRVVNYEWIESINGTKEIGFIAQEVEEIFPSLIITEPIKKKKEIEQEDGTIIEEEYIDGEFKSIKNSVLPYITIKALQELTTLVKEQQAQIEELNAKIEELRKV